MRGKTGVRGFLLMIAGLATFGMCFAARAAEEEDKPKASVDVGFFSKYIWRGYELSKNSLVIQPSATVSYKGFGLNLWGNLDTDVYGDERNEAKWNETDLTASYEYGLGPVTLGGGFIYYALDGVDDSREFYLSVSGNFLLAPTLTVYREVAHLPSWYLNLGISHSFELPMGMSLDLAGSIGYYSSDDDAFSKVDKDGNPKDERYRAFHDGKLSAGLTIPVFKYLTVSPMVAYSFALSGDADDLITAQSKSKKSDFVFGGITVSFSF